MRYAQRVVLPLVAVITACASPGAASAGPLLDWWMQRRNPQPVVVAQPAVSFAQACCDVSACNPCDTGCNTCTPGYGQQGYVQQQVVNYAPTYAAAPGYGYAAAPGYGYAATTAYMPNASYAATTAYMPAATTAYAPAVGYSSPAYVAAPQYRYRGFFPRYRTAWARVPVTNYRPVAAVDPNSGLAVTALQPCSTHDWQLRRVPVTLFNPGYYAAGASYAPFNSGAVVVQGATSSGCASCSTGGVMSSTTTAPYYGPTPAVTVPSGPASTVGPAETAPADVAPSLNPIDLNQGASLRSDRPAVQKGASPVEKSVIQPTGDRVTTPAWELDLGPGVQPVPDPDAPAADEPRSSEPELNHPRDLTAQAPVRRTWAYTPVSWAKGPAKQDQVIAPVVHATSAAAQQKQEVIWDASGWKSIAK